jgi:hypothetical protein
MIANVRYSVARGEWWTPVFLLAVVAGAVYEAGIALEWISVGDVSDEGGPYQGFFFLAALVGLLGGIVVSFAFAWRGRDSVFVALLGSAAAGLVIAHFYSFDLYYLPTKVRYAESGAFSASWVYVIGGMALLSTLLCLTRPRVGFILNVPTLLLCAFTVTFMGVGK